MKKTSFLIAAAVAALMTAPAVATAAEWTGFYVGASVNGNDFDLTDNATAGVFAGYRYDIGTVVIGSEIGATDVDNGGMNYVDLNVGYDFGDILGYAAVGYGDTDFNDGATASVGADYQFDNGVVLGAKYTRVDFTSTDLFTLRVGYSF